MQHNTKGRGVGNDGVDCDDDDKITSKRLIPANIMENVTKFP